MHKLGPLSFLTHALLAATTTLPFRRRQTNKPSTSSLNPLTTTNYGTAYEVEITINNRTFYVNPDTGSSDLWLPISTFKCIDHLSGIETSQESCNFGATYTVSNTTEYVSNQTFGVQYGSGIATGRVAYADVTLGGIRVTKQKIGLVDRTNDVSDGLGSGILGLGFPPLTSAHPGTEVDDEKLLFNRAVYDPLFVNMYKQGLVEPWYSFALARPTGNSSNSPGGYLGLGELPPVAHSEDWAVKKIEVTEGLPDELTEGQRLISLMTLTVDGVVYKSHNASADAALKGNDTTFQAVVDTGNHMNLFPFEIAEAINAGFEPAGAFVNSYHAYILPCNASIPKVGVILDGHTFWLQREDMMFPFYDFLCFSSISRTADDSGLSLNFLGDAFLRNVVAVFDFGKEEMRFASTTLNESGDSTGVDPIEGGGAPRSAAGMWSAGIGACCRTLAFVSLTTSVQSCCFKDAVMVSLS